MQRRGGRQARFVAGATDLMLQADRSVRILIDVTRLGLAYIKPQRGGWVIGAATTMSMLEHSAEMGRFADGILARAAAASGSVQIRNVATIGGNLANASPAADLTPPLLALDAQVVIVGQKGRRRLPLSQFFHGVHQTALNGALLAEIFIPPLPKGPSAWSFQKLGRVESDIALVNAAAGLGLSKDGRCLWARIAAGAVAPTPLRMQGVEKLLEGKPLDRALLEEACELVSREAKPVSDVRASALYRSEMIGVLVQRALEDCAARLEARGQGLACLIHEEINHG